MRTPLLTPSLKRFGTIALLLGTLSSTGMLAPEAAGQTEAELKERFGQRLEVLERLKDRGQIGETTEGLVEIVPGVDASQQVDVPGEGSMTIQAFVRDENTDRRKLYQLIGSRTGDPVDEVARQAAIRNYRRADPDHFLQLPNHQWIQKRELPEP